MTPVAIGLRAQRGGAVVVAVDGEPRVVFSGFMETAEAGDRTAFEPYHLAAEIWAADADRDKARAVVDEGRKRQDALAASGLGAIVAGLRDRGFDVVKAVLLVNRAGWVTDLFAYSLAYADHPPVAEGLAVRDALRFAVRELGIPLVESDEKGLPGLASAVLGRGEAAIEAELKVLGAGIKPWRKEQKLACLAAWLALFR